MIWKLIAKGRFTSKDIGTEMLYSFAVQDWGLQVKDLQIAMIVVDRSSANAKVRVREDRGASSDYNAFTQGSDVIAATQLTGFSLPRTLQGSVASYNAPFFRVSLGVAANAGAVEESVDVELYAGGKAY